MPFLLRILATLALLWLTQPAPPPFTARWASSSIARLSWTQPADVALTCLYRETTLIRCWADLASGATFTTLGARGPLDASAHPHSGDTYTLTLDNAQQQTRLGWALWIAQITARP